MHQGAGWQEGGVPLDLQRGVVARALHLHRAVRREHEVPQPGATPGAVGGQAVLLDLGLLDLVPGAQNAPAHASHRVDGLPAPFDEVVDLLLGDLHRLAVGAQQRPLPLQCGLELLVGNDEVPAALEAGYGDGLHGALLGVVVQGYRVSNGGQDEEVQGNGVLALYLRVAVGKGKDSAWTTWNSAPKLYEAVRRLSGRWTRRRRCSRRLVGTGGMHHDGERVTPARPGPSRKAGLWVSLCGRTGR